MLRRWSSRLHANACAQHSTWHACKQERHSIPVAVFILSEPEDWKAALALNGGGPGAVTAIQTDSPAALRKWLLGT